jgi:Icc-related predicted phosphoesterase
MRLIIISDTHGHHEELGIFEGDVLIHCGDAFNGFGKHPRDLARLDDWFGRQRCATILCIGGNHDFDLEDASQAGGPVFEHARYLEDEAYEVDGVRFYGSPWTPELRDWAFYLDPGRPSPWAAIPADTDVLITHTPPAGILDRNSGGRRCGCPDLARRAAEIAPAVHCFGHVHASAGTEVRDGTTYINASVVAGRAYDLARSAFVHELVLT